MYLMAATSSVARGQCGEGGERANRRREKDLEREERALGRGGGEGLLGGGRWCGEGGVQVVGGQDRGAGRLISGGRASDSSRWAGKEQVGDRNPRWASTGGGGGGRPAGQRAHAGQPRII